MSALTPYAPYDRLQDSFVLLSRMVLLLNPTNFAIPAGVVATGGSGKSLPFQVAPNQALRVVKNSWGRCVAVAGSPNLQCESLQMQLQTNLGQPILMWSGFYSGDKLGTGAGAIVTTDGDDVLFGRDVLSQPGPTQPFFIVCRGDVFNSGGAAETAQIDGSLILELWQVSTLSRMRG